MVSNALNDITQDAVTGKTKQDSKSTSRGNVFETNPLNRYASFTPLFTLSSLTRNELQGLTYYDTNYKPQNVIARSGGIGNPNTKQNTEFTVEVNNANQQPNAGGGNLKQVVDELATDKLNDEIDNVRKYLNRAYDFFFERVVINTLPAASNDRQATAITNIEMEIHEPLGLNLVQTIRGAAANAGYLDHIDAPYLLTVDYKGYDDNGNFVSMGSEYVRKIPIKMIRMAVNVNQGGSIYTIKAIPYSEFAFVNRFNYTRMPFSLTTEGTLSSFCKDFTKKLNDQTEEEEKGKFFERADKYVITCDKSLDKTLIKIDNAEAQDMGDQINVTQDNNFNQQTQAQSYGGNKTGKDRVGQFPKGTAITQILQQVMKRVAPYDNFENFIKKEWPTKANGELAARIGDLENTVEARERFFKENEDKFYVDYFRVSSSVYQDNGPLDAITKKQRSIIHYHIEPYKVHILNFAQPGLHSNIRNFWNDAKRFMARKKYDYIFTGNNTEIMNLDINYNIAYYSSKFKGLQQQQNLIDQPTDNNTTRVFSRDEVVEKNLPHSAYPGSGKTTNVGFYGSNEQFDAFVDAFSNPESDMVNIEMEIRGDPVYLSANQFNLMSKPSDLNGGVYENKNKSKTTSDYTAYDSRSKSYNLNMAEPYVMVNFKAPVDIDLSTGLYKFDQGDDVVFNGLYRVVKIENIFQSGQFTQQLRLIRLKDQGNKVTKYIKVEKVNDSPTVGLVDSEINLDALLDDFGFNERGILQNIGSWINNKINKIKEIIKNNKGPYDGGPAA